MSLHEPERYKCRHVRRRHLRFFSNKFFWGGGKSDQRRAASLHEPQRYELRHVGRRHLRFFVFFERQHVCQRHLRFFFFDASHVCRGHLGVGLVSTSIYIYICPHTEVKVF